MKLKRYIYTSFALNALTVLLILLSLNNLPPVSPLLYGRPSGEGQLVSTIFLLAAPIFSFLITVTNSFLSVRIDNLFIKRILIITGFLVSVLTTITVFKIIFLIGFF